MRVLMVNNYHYPRGGSDRYFLDLSALLRGAGHTVSTFSTTSEADTDSSHLATESLKPIDTARIGSPATLGRFLFNPESRAAMRRVVRDFRPDIAHLHIYYGQLTASILAPLRSEGVPIVQTLHEFKTVCPTHGLTAGGAYCDACQGKHFWRAALKKCNRGSTLRSAFSALEAYLSQHLGAVDAVDRFIAVSEFQRRKLVELGLPAVKVDVIHNFTRSKPIRESAGGEYFLVVARLTEGKGIRTLLSALALLEDTDVRLHIAGTGDQAATLQQFAVEKGVQDRVTWLGHITGRDLDLEYQGALALVNPSEVNETFGLTALEAMTVGCPVIASAIGALPEVVRHGKDGLIFPPGDHHSLAAAMRRLIDEVELRRDLGTSSAERVSAQFSEGEHLSRILKVYEAALQCRFRAASQ